MDDDMLIVERYGLRATTSNGTTYTIRRLDSRPNGVLEARRQGTFTDEQQAVLRAIEGDLRTPRGHRISVVMTLLDAGFTVQAIPVEGSSS